MKHQQLIRESKTKLAANPPYIKGIVSPGIFDLGAKWMFDKLNDYKTYEENRFNSSTNFFAYGVLKYGLSFSAFLLSAFLFLELNIFLVPLSIFMFYLVEVHFLFLFPILIDNVEKPILTSIKQTYRIGILNVLLTVIPIGFFMVIGLLRFKAPYRNWYVGCLAIIIWYQNEIRDRI